MTAPRIFLSGPMSGLPDFNRPAFNREADRLRQLGWVVLSPSENPAPACGSWAGWMRMSITQLMCADLMVTLPGWIDSEGARLEQVIAQMLQIPIYLSGEIVRGDLQAWRDSPSPDLHALYGENKRIRRV